MVRVHRGTVTVGVLLALFGCGLDGISGQLLRIEHNHYFVRTAGGTERVLHVDDRTRKDPVSPGDHIHAYVAKDGHAEFLQRLDP